MLKNRGPKAFIKRRQHQFNNCFVNQRILELIIVFLNLFRGFGFASSNLVTAITFFK